MGKCIHVFWDHLLLHTAFLPNPCVSYNVLSVHISQENEALNFHSCKKLNGADTHLFIICVHKVNNGLFGFFLLHQIQAWCVWIWNVPKPVWSKEIICMVFMVHQRLWAATVHWNLYEYYTLDVRTYLRTYSCRRALLQRDTNLRPACRRLSGHEGHFWGHSPQTCCHSSRWSPKLPHQVWRGPSWWQ